MPGSDADDLEYEDTLPFDEAFEQEDEEEEEEAVPPPQPEFATGALPDGRRFAAVFCSPTIGPLAYLAEAQEMLDAGVLSSDANLSQGATLDAVKKLMRDFDPHILWFVGHGNAMLAGELTLCWTTDSGGAVLIDARACSDVLSAHTPKRGGSLECVVLNGCQTMKDGAALGLCADSTQTGAVGATSTLHHATALTCTLVQPRVHALPSCPAVCCTKLACRSLRAGARFSPTTLVPSSRGASSKHCRPAKITPRRMLWGSER